MVSLGADNATKNGAWFFGGDLVFLNDKYYEMNKKLMRGNVPQFKIALKYM